jgi:hypothetical protein
MIIYSNWNVNCFGAQCVKRLVPWISIHIHVFTLVIILLLNLIIFLDQFSNFPFFFLFIRTMTLCSVSKTFHAAWKQLFCIINVIQRATINWTIICVAQKNPIFTYSSFNFMCTFLSGALMRLHVLILRMYNFVHTVPCADIQNEWPFALSCLVWSSHRYGCACIFILFRHKEKSISP